MILVDEALRRRAEAGNFIRVGMVGAGFQGKGIARQILSACPGIRLVGVANRNVEPACECYRQLGIEPTIASSAGELVRAVETGAFFVTTDAELLASSPHIDVLLEVTGAVEFAARAVVAAIDAGKHVVHMNAELDGTIGPILKRRADAAGVIYSFSDGDQPGVQMNLFRLVRGLGLKPVLCGNIKGLHDPYRNPATQAAFAARWGQKPAMVASFADGTKISFEQAIVANATGFKVAKRGMIGPDFSNGDPASALVALEETVAAFVPYLDVSEDGLVDYVVGASPGPGVFVLATCPDPVQQQYLELYKMGVGPYYCFYTPYHLCHFEVPNSIARAVLFGDTVLAPTFGPRVGVVAVAKTDLEQGQRIDSFGGFEVYGVAENVEVIRAERLLPVGLAIGTETVRPIRKDRPLMMEDVHCPPHRLVDSLYEEQEAVFAPEPRGATVYSRVHRG